MAAILKILNGGYHKNQVIRPDILYHLLHSWPSIHQISCKYSHVDQSYSNFEFSVVTILKKINGAYYKNQVICPYIWYDLLYSWPSIHKIPCKYSHVDQSYSNFEFSVAAILKIQNGGRYGSQITCLHFLYDSNNKKLSIHKISCFYDNLNNIATNRSTIYKSPLFGPSFSSTSTWERMGPSAHSGISSPELIVHIHDIRPWAIYRGISTTATSAQTLIWWPVSLLITSPPEGVARYCFHPVCLSVCVCVCVSVCVCPADILLFYFSAIRRDIDLKFIQDTYRVRLNSLKIIDLHRSKVKVTGAVHCFFKKLSHRKISFFFHRHLLGYSIRWNNKNSSEQRNDVTKNTSIFDFNM